MEQTKPCPACGHPVTWYRNPVPTVDVVIYVPQKGVVLIRRRNVPPGWALPGGFVDYGESVEQAAIREAHEETGLDVELYGLLGVYSDPRRDPRQHTLSVVFLARPTGACDLRAGDDAAEAAWFPMGMWPEHIAFDHGDILHDFQENWKRFQP